MSRRSMTPEARDGDNRAVRNLAAIAHPTRPFMFPGGPGRAPYSTTR